MSGAWHLAVRQAKHHPVRTVLIILSVAVAVAVPLAARVLSRGFEAGLKARAATTGLVAGAKGNRFDLVMACLYFRKAELDQISMKEWELLQESGLAIAIPVNASHTARGIPIVATTSDYFDVRTLRFSKGARPTRIGDVCLGSKAASELKVAVGDSVFSDQVEAYDIAKPPALKMRVVGILEPTGSPDDLAVFTDIKTAWVLEGLSHGHAPPEKIPESLLLEKTEKNIAVSEQLVDHNQVTDANVTTFHLHATSDQLPLTGVLLFPFTDKDASVLKARLNVGKHLQAAAPIDVVNDLLAYVVQIERLMAGLSIVLAGLTVALISLVTMLSVKARSREIETLQRIGVSRPMLVRIFAMEIAGMVGLGVGVAVGGVWILSRVGPDLVKFL